MQRRTFITTVAASLGTTALAGCIAGNSGDAAAGGSDTDQPSDTDSPESSPTLSDASLERREDCSSAGSASIAAESNAVTVQGCIQGSDGCQVPALADTSYDEEADELTVTVTTEKGTDADTCTQQIVQLGYTATVQFEGGLPKTTTVNHQGAGESGQVAQAETN
jgi:hypothetical protein